MIRSGVPFRVLSRPSVFNGTLRKQIGGLRAYSSTNNPKASGSNGKIILALGALAIGSTVASALYTKGSPVSSVDSKLLKPTFSPDEAKVIFVLGGPGAGKGTQCSRLVQNKGFVHLSAGDLLREEQKREGSQYGELIGLCIKDGKIVPQEVTVALLENAIKKNVDNGQRKFLIDGFPRKMDQALTFELKVAKASFILFFECPEDVMLKRLLERGKTSGRADDNIESIKKRFATFIDTSMPVVDYFDKQGRVVKVRCDSPVEDVYKHVLQAIDSRNI